MKKYLIMSKPNDKKSRWITVCTVKNLGDARQALQKYKEHIPTEKHKLSIINK